MLCTGLQFSKLYDQESLIKNKKKWFYIYGSIAFPNWSVFFSKIPFEIVISIFLISSSQKNESNKWRNWKLNIPSPRKFISRKYVFCWAGFMKDWKISNIIWKFSLKKKRKDDQLPSVHREPGLDSQQEYEDLPSRQMINQRSFYQKYIKYL